MSGHPFAAELASLHALVQRLDQCREALGECAAANRSGAWQEHELELLYELYPNTPNALIARALGRTDSSIKNAAIAHELRKSAAYLATGPGRFRAGQEPPNKGVKGWQSGGRSVATQFKKGRRPHTWKPIGSERVNDGYLQRKMTDTGYPPRDWKPVHVLLWVEHHGEVPPKHVVVFRNGDKTDIRIENLECISRAELASRNTIHRYPPEVKELIRLRGKVIRAIRRREKSDEKPVV